MKTMNKTIEKRVYSCPEIRCIVLDNEILLALESSPPVSPEEGIGAIFPEFSNNDPFKNYPA